jgi:tetratricopeptide (TPR) repeat protein
MPKPADEDGKKKKKAAKGAKKDGPPIKPIKWEDGPPRYVKHTLHYMNEARQDIVENIFPLNLRGDQGNPGVAPCIIKEVYFPPEAPSEVATLIESALVYQNSSNFEMAIKCFNDSKDLWLSLIKGNKDKSLKKEQELFYDLSIASVYESCGKDDLALNTYMKAKAVKLPYNHPDRAFSYCGLGSVLFHMEEPAWALRLYLSAR